MPELSGLLQVLLSPEAYPHKPKQIELLQTRISAVFLAGDYVYKIKKPVLLDFLDFTSLDKRHFYCHQEVRLNRRLCPDAYLGVVPIIQDKDRYYVEGSGTAIEYAVKMKHLPHGRMMDKLLDAGQVTPQRLDVLANKLAEF
ncbi:MAG: aminoglycoside phosphotransferase, partial [Dehalococcoidia bacterium]|nr:aminoglycoside phosphotransferase [Dehalococcoidia bacterium]